MLQKLKTPVKRRIKEDQELQLKIARLFDKRNIVTVQRWIAKDNPLLLLPDVLEVVRTHAGFAEDVELTEMPKARKKAAA